MESKAFSDAYKKLNPAQKEAVDAIEGPVMIIAGPGSGKTQVLSLRVANILLRTDARPSNILCLTFTDAAAVNMRKRLSLMIGADAYRVSIHTFHSFGTEMIDRYPEHFYNGARFSPSDDLAQIEVLEKIIESLPERNLLRARHPEQGFVYLRDIRDSIGQLKKAGIAPDEFERAAAHIRAEAEEANGILAPLFDGRLSMKTLGEVQKALEKIRHIDKGEFPVPHFRPYSDALAASLAAALTEAEASGKTEPLSRFKTAMFGKNEDGRALKDLLNLSKVESLAGIYAAYLSEMHARGYFDFDDMILDVIAAAETDGGFRAELQEQYQYILVDEFQDTNDAQMRLLSALLDAGVNEGRPNVCVVGDDDQAIYKFQGAELSNILSFNTSYKDPKIITLTHNYRSTQTILDLASYVIARGEDRLENLLPGVRKDLVAAHPDLAGGEIVCKNFPAVTSEYRFVAREIKRRIAAGESAASIAVIARKHASLEALVPYLNEASVPIRYDRQSNVLKEIHIRQLLSMARFADSLMRRTREEADYLLPEILSFPFWNISRKTVWQISLEADRARTTWLDVMLSHKDIRVRKIAEFFLDLSQVARYETAERVLDLLIGSRLSRTADSEGSESEEYDDGADFEVLPPRRGSRKSTFESPFKEYYWNAERLKENKAEYLIFLSNLRFFVNAVREYRKGDFAKLEDVVTFADLHEKNGLSISDTGSFANAFDAVSLVTAHKAKGLEWETVFILNCRDDVWAGRGSGRKISFPLNLPIAPAGDTVSDQLRLFYVALTRAKRNLYLTSSASTEAGREALKLQFLVPKENTDPELAQSLLFSEEKGSVEDAVESLKTATSAFYRDPILYDEKAFLETLVEDYSMSVTHLNNFLDISKGGPAFFFEQNLIRFPQEPSLSSKFGTALHKLIERIYGHLKFEGKLPEKGLLSDWLEFELRKFRMTEADLKRLRARGEECIAAYLAARGEMFDPADKIEVNFESQGVVLGDAVLTGKIDKMVRTGEKEWNVCDFKTGSAETDWDGGNPYEKLKLHRYKNQLVFYKILVENSREFGDSRVKEGSLEFLEPLPAKGSKGRIVSLPLEISDEETARLKKLAEIVYAKIRSLEFPDTSGYKDDLSGVLAFEEDLLLGKI